MLSTQRGRFIILLPSRSLNQALERQVTAPGQQHEMHTSSHRIQSHLQLIYRLSEIPGPLEQLSNGSEGAVLTQRAHTEDLGLCDLLNAPDTVLVHQRLGLRHRQFGQGRHLWYYRQPHGQEVADWRAGEYGHHRLPQVFR